VNQRDRLYRACCALNLNFKVVCTEASQAAKSCEISIMLPSCRNMALLEILESYKSAAVFQRDFFNQP